MYKPRSNCMAGRAQGMKGVNQVRKRGRPAIEKQRRARQLFKMLVVCRLQHQSTCSQRWRWRPSGSAHGSGGQLSGLSHLLHPSCSLPAQQTEAERWFPDIRFRFHREIRSTIHWVTTLFRLLHLGITFIFDHKISYVYFFANFVDLMWFFVSLKNIHLKKGRW